MQQRQFAERRGLVVVHQVIPPRRERADQRLVRQPLELVQVEAARPVHVLQRQRPAARVVHQHQARPVLLLVHRLLVAEELPPPRRHVLVLDHLHGVAVVAQLPEPREVVAHQDVRVGEDGPARVVAEVGDQKPGERKVG
jgi:hypothetical protein